MNLHDLIIKYCEEHDEVTELSLTEFFAAEERMRKAGEITKEYVNSTSKARYETICEWVSRHPVTLNGEEEMTKFFSECFTVFTFGEVLSDCSEGGSFLELLLPDGTTTSTEGMSMVEMYRASQNGAMFGIRKRTGIC